MTPYVMGILVASMMTTTRLNVDVAAFDDGALPGVVIKLKAPCDNSCKDGDFQCLLYSLCESVGKVILWIYHE